MERMSVAFTEKSSTAMIKRGNLPRRSEPGVAVVSTEIGKQFSNGLDATPETVKALVAIITALLAETLSGDVIFLSMGAAEKMAIGSGVSPEEFHRVKGHILRFWQRKKAQHPLAGMF